MTNLNSNTYSSVKEKGHRTSSNNFRNQSNINRTNSTTVKTKVKYNSDAEKNVKNNFNNKAKQNDKNLTDSKSSTCMIFSKDEFHRVMQKAKHVAKCVGDFVYLKDCAVSYSVDSELKLFKVFLNFDTDKILSEDRVEVQYYVDGEQTYDFVKRSDVNCAFMLAVYLQLHQEILLWGGLKGYSKEEVIAFKCKLEEQIELTKKIVIDYSFNIFYSYTKLFIKQSLFLS